MKEDIYDALHAEKYRAPGQSFREWANTVATRLKDNDDHWRKLRTILLEQRFCPGGRIQLAMGTSRSVTAFNCFVMPAIRDSFVEGNNSIMDVAKKAAATMRLGGGVGYDFSTLRPKGDAIKKLGSRSSGPVSFMQIFDAICKTVASAGQRRGAQMAMLNVSHPDIEEFIRAKQNTTNLTQFNISVAVTDQFMRAMMYDGNNEFDLRWNGATYNSINSRQLWEEIMRATWDWAEPGVIFIDRINQMNNLYYCETIAATNPCAEQPLPPDGACLLGSFNLVKYVSGNKFDYDKLTKDIYPVVRAMDNVIDNTIYPLVEQELEAKQKRRMGLGVMGMANAIEKLGASYGSDHFLEIEGRILKYLRDMVYIASAELAQEKGAFDMFHKDKYLAGEFVKQLPDNIKDKIAAHGIRNSHLTSIAPTGTISLCAGNVSSGIEPPFALKYKRKIKTWEGEIEVELEDYGKSVLGVTGKTAMECTVNEHIKVLAMAQRFVDSSVSKTVNVPSSIPWADYKQAYIHAWQLGCKGLATFTTGGKRQGIMSIDEDTRACYIDPATGAKTCEVLNG